MCYALFVLVAGCGTAPEREPAKRPDLCSSLPDELNFIHKTLAENNSDYNGSDQLKSQSELVFNEERGRKCESELDYVRSIKRYLASFHDPHITSLWTAPDQMHAAVIEISTGAKIPKFQATLHFTATGLYLQRYDDRYFVRGVDEKTLKSNLPIRVGDELLDCESQAPATILANQILPFVSVSAKEAALYRLTPMIFSRWDKNTGAQISCRFRTNGESRTVSMNWVAVADDYISKTFQPAPEKIYEIEKITGGHWVKLKSLGGYNAKITDQLKKFVEEATSLRADRLIVVDLRGNGGGSSSWGTDWIEKLWGYHTDFDKGIHESVWISGGNRIHFQRLYDNIKSQGGIESNSAKANWSDLLAAHKSGKTGTFGELHGLSEPESKKKRSAFRGRVIVLTDFNVFSSGETFLEQLKLMPNVKQAGIPTNASTYFSDVRFVTTPLGLPFDFPTKMDSGDPLGRKSGQSLTPDWPLSYNGEEEIIGKDSLRKALGRKLGIAL